MGDAYQYTMNMETLFRNRTSELRTFYCREDFEYAIKRCKHAKKDAKEFRRHDLDVLCRAREIDTDELLRDSRLIETIPTRSELKEKLLEILYELYSEVPTAADYMERTVRRLAPEYGADPVRVAILKKFVMGGGPGWGAFKTTAVLGWAVQQMTEGEREAYDGASAGQELKMAVDRLDDSIFSGERMATELTTAELLGLMERRLSLLCTRVDVTDQSGRSCGFAGLELRSETREQMLRFCAERAVPCSEGCTDGELLSRTAEACGGADDRPAFLPALEKDFSDLLKRTCYRTQKGKLDTADSLFKTDKRDAKKKKGEDWALLRLCDDLARGRFKTNGGQTRVYLYYFAIMFGMTIVLRETDEYDERTNMVKNLFEDYYSDNLIRYLDASYANPQFSSSLEKEPGGEGINYKNFAEAIYIYYLYRRDLELTPGERIDHAERMIDRCVRRADAAGGTAPGRRAHTMLFRQRYLDRIIDADEKELAARILANYRIEGSSARILYSAERNTAYDIVRETMEDLEASEACEVSLQADFGTNLESKALADRLMEEAKQSPGVLFDWKLAPLLKEKYRDDLGFVRVIDNLNERITAEFDWVGVRKKSFLVRLLHTLYHSTGEGSPMRLEKLKELLQKTDISITGSLIVHGAEILAAMGFDVGRDTAKGESRFWLGARSYGDPRLNQVISRVKNRYYVNETVLQTLLTEILEEKRFFERKVTRTTLIAIYTSYYLSLLQDTYGIESLPDLYDDFTSSINPILEEARFQTLNEKNILDMYVLLSLYFYLIENGK